MNRKGRGRRRDGGMMPKALKPNENITAGGGSLIYGESCNTLLIITVHWGKVRGAAAHQWLCELLSGALTSVALFPKLSAVVYSTVC